MDESGNLAGYIDAEGETVAAQQPVPSVSRPPSRRVVMVRQPDHVTSAPEPQPSTAWQPERPLPSHIEAMDEGPFDNPTVVTRTIDGLRIPIANLRVVDRDGMDEARAEAVRLLQRMAPDLSVGSIPAWGELLSILAVTSQARRQLFDQWYEHMAYLCIDGLWFSTEECLLGVHRPLARNLGLRRLDCDGLLCWRGDGMLWTDAQLTFARTPATWSSKLFRRLGWQ